mmetsp:Transcript_16362/g.27672  ORF Transcript_16362/g.27672 Transcript_16362/m.27672 type:complete len:184 (+) Transcript_16362:2099-2650(+)
MVDKKFSRRATLSGNNFNEKKIHHLNRAGTVHSPQEPSSPGGAPAYNKFGVGESNRMSNLPNNLHGRDLQDSRRSEMSLGKTQYSHNFDRSMLKNNLVGNGETAKRSMQAMRVGSPHGPSSPVGQSSLFVNQNPLQHTAVKMDGEYLAQSSETADMYMHISGDQNPNPKVNTSNTGDEDDEKA